MNIKFLLFLVFLSNVLFGQTKKETIDWLNLKLEGCPTISMSYCKNKRYLKIEYDGTFSIESYDFSIYEQYLNSNNYKSKVVFSGNFKELSPNSVRTKIIQDNLFIYATCSNGKCVTQTNLGPDEYYSIKSAEVLLGVTSNVELEFRCKKAFIHLINLCGGKNEPF
jgi:hypothetical protein